MPQFKWNELDFLDCFGVEPSVEDYGVLHSYEILREGLRLLVTVGQLESLIYVSLFRGNCDDAVFAFVLYARGAARFINDQRGRFLGIEDCIVAPSRFWCNRVGDVFGSGDVFDREHFPYSVTATIAVDPDIRIALVDYKSRT